MARGKARRMVWPGGPSHGMTRAKYIIEASVAKRRKRCKGMAEKKKRRSIFASRRNEAEIRSINGNIRKNVRRRPAAWRQSSWRGGVSAYNKLDSESMAISEAKAKAE